MVMKKTVWPQNNADVCIRCATCMAVCPVSRVTPLFPGPKQAGPGAERFRQPGEPSVDEWIDLCIGCHLCDMVCSSGVNISELNLIAKAKYLDEKRRPFRDWLLTHTYLFGWLGSLFSPVVNWFLRNSAVKWIAETILKIDRRRQLPSYESPTFRQWFRGHHSEGDRKVGYFYGCYTNTNEVDVGKATVQVLEAMGSRSSFLLKSAAASQCLGMEISKVRGEWDYGMSPHFFKPFAQVLISSFLQRVAVT